MSMGATELKDILEKHRKWARSEEGGQRAYLQGADLRGADLQRAYLQGAYLRGADLQRAYLQGADLRGADLQRAYLQGAYLRGADLQGAYLQGAYLQGADLRGAYLQGAYLQGAYLQGADLQRAYLQGAYLRGADLQGAYLQGAYLQGAYLQGAYLQGAYLQGADLRGADLQGAYLQRAYLQRAYLQGADLQRAKLDEIKKDFFERLALAKGEVAGLYDALMRGKIDGTAYQGECACFIGTIANLRKENYEKLGIDLRPSSSSPTERWFLAILKGDTPQSNQVADITSEWIEEFALLNLIELPDYKLVSSAEFPDAFV